MSSDSDSDEWTDEETIEQSIKDELCDIIQNEEVDRLKTFLTANKNPGTLFNVLFDAIQVANTKMIKLLVESGVVKLDTKEMYCPSALSFLAMVDLESTKKLEIAKILLPYMYAENLYPWALGYFSPYVFFEDLYEFCTHGENLVCDLYIERFYRGTRCYELVRKLLETVEDAYLVAICLHNEIYDLEEFVDDRNFCIGIAKIFLKLLMLDTSDAMELAVETFKKLLCKNLPEVFVHSKRLAKIVEENIDPLLPKRIFHFVYRSLDSETEDFILEMIDTWMLFVNATKKISEWSVIIQCLSPIMMFLDEKSAGTIEKPTTLKEKCRDVIRNTIYENLNIKECLDAIWKFPLPVILKCFLLDIPDADWMNDIQ